MIYKNIYIKNEKVSELLSVDWYIQSPIDFEHKQYKLLSYLQVVDSHFILKRLSPHLLHMESMIREMVNFQESLTNMKKRFDKERYVLIFSDNPKLKGEDNELVQEINEIVNFSLPLVQNRIELGKYILKKNRQVLY